MIISTQYKGKNVAVFGLGGSGLATALSLKAGGANVYAYDDGEASRAKALEAGINIQDLRELNWGEINALVLSPGVPLTHPEPHWSAVLARENNVPIIGDLELFYREVHDKSRIIAITGTNGKSTTTALIGHLLAKMGENVQIGGNIGKAVLTLEPPREDEIYVVECSSFQIDLAPSLSADVAVLTNITPDHIDRHGTIENYAKIKASLVLRSESQVIGIDDDYTRQVSDQLNSAITVSVTGKADISYTPHNLIFEGQKISLEGIAALRGRHNAQNAGCAIGALVQMGFNLNDIVKHLASFGGLAHRMEEVGRFKNLTFINDSKATNADSTEKALLSFENIYWIAGGKSKEGGIEPLKPYFNRIKKSYLIGYAAQDFAKTLGSEPFQQCETIDKALEAAVKEALLDEKPAVILLSPACASYDQFKSFEHRGDVFRELVKTYLPSTK